jgi:chromate reductase
MAGNAMNVVSICGNLRKGSYNAGLMRMLPGLAPAEMTITPTPSYEGFPHYNHDLQVPADVVAVATRSATPTASSSYPRNTDGQSRVN